MHDLLLGEITDKSYWLFIFYNLPEQTVWRTGLLFLRIAKDMQVDWTSHLIFQTIVKHLSQMKNKQRRNKKIRISISFIWYIKIFYLTKRKMNRKKREKLCCYFFSNLLTFPGIIHLLHNTIYISVYYTKLSEHVSELRFLLRRLNFFCL